MLLRILPFLLLPFLLVSCSGQDELDCRIEDRRSGKALCDKSRYTLYPGDDLRQLALDFTVGQIGTRSSSDHRYHELYCLTLSPALRKSVDRNPEFSCSSHQHEHDHAGEYLFPDQMTVVSDIVWRKSNRARGIVLLCARNQSEGNDFWVLNPAQFFSARKINGVWRLETTPSRSYGNLASADRALLQTLGSELFRINHQCRSARGV